MLPTRLVQMIDGQMIVSTFGPEVDVIAAMEIRGYPFARLNANPRQRAELQGAPVFANLAGPMWDGDALRYEDSAANDALSI